MWWFVVSLKCCDFDDRIEVTIHPHMADKTPDIPYLKIVT